MATGLLKIGKRIQQQVLLSDILPPEFVISDTIDTNVYTDVTSNQNWMSVGVNIYDYLFCRNQVKMLTYVTGFSAMTIEEKRVAATVFAVGSTERSEVFTIEENESNWSVFVEKSLNCRLERWNKAKSYISYLLPPIDSTDLALSTEALSKNYIEYGIESLAIDGVTGLYDWLENDFTLKSYYNETYKNNIISILQEGFY